MTTATCPACGKGSTLDHGFCETCTAQVRANPVMTNPMVIDATARVHAAFEYFCDCMPARLGLAMNPDSSPLGAAQMTTRMDGLVMALRDESTIRECAELISRRAAELMGQKRGRDRMKVVSDEDD